MSGVIIGSGIGALVLIIALILLISRRKNSGDDYDEEIHEGQEKYEHDIPLSGPPATAFAGPPQIHYNKKVKLKNTKGN